ncbi:MAG: hypothetical protein LBI66_12635 [Burkholderiaceae bacterium]|jgi:hypothetical protein|nr:hypothetical protein [Burkholderiaceae bacterium]
MFKKALATAILLGCGLAHAFMPSNGTWVVTSELNGEPGRGLAIDAQNGTLVLQMYGYEPGSQPTFYMSSGRLSNNRFSASLMRYRGGRYLGSGPMTGVADRDMGQVSLRFTSGVSGFITLPGEPEVAISRFNFGYPATADSLRGTWALTSFGSEGVRVQDGYLIRYLAPTRDGNGLMATDDGLFACEHQVRGALAGEVLCVLNNTAGQLERSYRFVYSVNDGEGESRTYGDRPAQTLFAKRLTTPQGDRTGIVYNYSGPMDGSRTALHEQIEKLASEAVPLTARD